MDDNYFQPEKIPKLDPHVLQELSTLQPWRSFLAIVLDWSVIALYIYICVTISYWLYPLAFVLIGNRFHALEAMMHEAAHYRLHSNKMINELAGEVTAWPLGVSLLVYRKIRHFPHHRKIGTRGDSHVYQTYEKDVDAFTFPKKRLQIVRDCLKVAFRFPIDIWLGQILGNARTLMRLSKTRAVLWISGQLLIPLLIVLGVFYFGWDVLIIYLLFFVAPLMWVGVVSRYLRLIFEHFGIEGESFIGGETRTVMVSWIWRTLLWPHNLNYHLEHHWYPSVPFYNLPQLHKHLIANPEVKKKMHITIGISNLFKELSTV